MNVYPQHYRQVDGIHHPEGGTSSEFTYSDGEEFEKRIEAIIASASDRSLFSAEIRNAIWDWRSSCHLSPVRANILRPIEWACRGRVLELGAGCGIITRYLGEVGGDVVALEGSAFRAGVTRLRTADLENVKVVCDRIEDFEAAQKFDAVTMIGVLQYARLYGGGDGAELALIENATRQLDDDGVLIIGIQNRLGLKYFAGYPEANAGLPYFGIEGRYGPDTVVRFGLDELKKILAAAGLGHQAILLPLPDYHMPTTILSDKALQREGGFSAAPFLSTSVGRDRVRSDWIRPAFSMEKAWESVNDAGLALGLANAFLVVAGKSERSIAFQREGMDLAWHYSADRHSSFATVKRFTEEGGEISINRSRLNSAPATNSFLSHTVSHENYVEGRLWWSSLVDIVNRPGWCAVEIGDWSRRWIIELCAAGDLTGYSNLPRLDTLLPGYLFDSTPMNCIYGHDDTFTFIDNEWHLHSPLKLSYLVIRGLFGSLISISSCARPAANTPVNVVALIKMAASSIGIDITNENIDEFIEQEWRIQSVINKGFESEADSTWSAYVQEVSMDCRQGEGNEILRLREELAATGAKLESTRADLELTMRNSNYLEEELSVALANAEIQLNSLSWRITAPLRAINRLLQK